MKTQLFTLAMLGSFAGLCSGCFQPLEEVSNESPSSLSQTTLKLNTRSATGIIDYPVLVLAYDADGNKSAQQIISSEAEQVKLKLPVGTYRLSAISGYSAYTQPDDYSTSDAVFTIPALGYASSPLFIGSADVDLGEKSATVDVVMSSRSSAMEISLRDLPASVDATSVTIARQYASLGMDGKFTSSTVAKVNCVKSDDGAWTTGKFYVFPGSEAQTVLTITITDNQQQYSYGYTVNEPLKAAVPYTMTGSYKAGERVESFDLSGSLIVESWQDPKSLNFEFGEGASADGSTTEEIIEDGQVQELPHSMSIWNGHVVVLALEKTSTQETLWLISLQEETNVYSAYASGHESDARNYAVAYTEGDLTGWSIPTNYEMQQIKQYYKDENMEYLNDVIAQAGGTGIQLKDSKGENVRYLCDNALRAIGFTSGSKIGDAGISPKYSLRLLKKVRVTLNP